jgi:hypothetical protein
MAQSQCNRNDRVLRCNKATCWFKKKPKKPAPFAIVTPSRFLAEYRGTIVQTPYALHHLTCTKLTPEQAEALKEGASLPSHILYCVCYLFRAPSQPRLLFNAPIVVSDAIAIAITKDVAKAMLKADRVFLVRCRDRAKAVKRGAQEPRLIHVREFPWCISGEAFDQFWAIELRSWYRLRKR